MYIGSIQNRSILQSNNCAAQYLKCQRPPRTSGFQWVSPSWPDHSGKDCYLVLGPDNNHKGYVMDGLGIALLGPMLRTV